MITQNELLDLQLEYKNDPKVLRLIEALQRGGYYDGPARGVVERIPRPHVAKEEKTCVCKKCR